ncbi:MAG: hypothetical protein V4522_13200 [Pseudomonadota bacterium]
MEVAASSPAPQSFEPPTDPAQNLEWRKTGALPAEKKEVTPKEDSTPSEEDASADGSHEPAARTAPESAPGTKQERAKEPTAADRLKELFADLKRAGLSPAELKTFRREAQTAKPDAAPASTTESTAKPQGLTAPVKPKQADFESWEKFDEARDKYTEDFATYQAKLAVQEDRQARAAEAQSQAMTQKVTEAKARYGDETEATIQKATSAIVNDTAIPLIIPSLMAESAVLVDVMYVLGSKPEELASFVALAKSNPGAAIRKFALLEQLVEQELKTGGKAAAAETAATTSAERDATGKFVSQDPPAKKKPAAPPPPEELSTRGSAPPDPIEAAFRSSESSGDARAFIDAETRREIARRKGA